VLTHFVTLDVPAETATLLTELLIAERLRRGSGVCTGPRDGAWSPPPSPARSTTR
jgi:hypothetical protein